jgi:Dihydrodipicolinate synthase/N-acetylneuraminate lyase
MNPLQGLCAFPITPTDQHGSVDTQALGALISRIRTARADSICVLGSTGTYPFLTRAERRRTIEFAVSQAGTTPIFAAIGALRTDEVIALGRDAQEAGVSAALLAPVSYTPLTDREVFTLFETVNAALDIPICIYNNPGTTHFTFSNQLIGRLSKLAHVMGAKNPAPAPDGIVDNLADLRGKAAPGFSLGYSKDWYATEALIAGADAWYSVIAGLFPEACVRIVSAIKAGDLKLARSLNGQLEPLWTLFKELSSLRVMYAAASHSGLVHAAPPLPILPLADNDRQRVETVLDRLQLR